MPAYFDIHSHVSFPEYAADRAEVLARMREKDVWTITVGTNLETSRSAVGFASKNVGIFASIGLHPVDDAHSGIVSSFDENDFAQLVINPKVVTIGECGLDYGRTDTVTSAEKVLQKKDFEKQIEFAVKYNKPLMLHVRSAHADCLDMLASKKREYGERLRGNSHFFSGSTEIEKKYLELGFSVSFTGVITFTHDYDEAVKYAPFDMIMSETDAPYVAPVPFRGKRNEPIYVEEVVKKMAQIKGKTVTEMQEIVVQNALRIFSISS